MSTFSAPAMTRSAFIASSTASAADAILPFSLLRPARAAPITEMRLRASPGRTRLVPEPHGETPAWCYNGQVPGPEIRVRQGDRLRVHVENSLEEETTVHWHGLRVPHATIGRSHV